MNVSKLKPADQITLADGSLAEVIAVLEGTFEVRVKYLDVIGEQETVGQEAVVSGDEVIAIMQGTHTEGAA